MNWLRRWWGFLRATTNSMNYRIVEMPCIICPQNLVATYLVGTVNPYFICAGCGTKYEITFRNGYPYVHFEEE